MKPILSYQWTTQWTTAIIGIALAVIIVLMGLFPFQTAQFGALLGVNYPPVLILTIGMGLILVKILSIDLDGRARKARCAA